MFTSTYTVLVTQKAHGASLSTYSLSFQINLMKTDKALITTSTAKTFVTMLPTRRTTFSRISSLYGAIQSECQKVTECSFMNYFYTLKKLSFFMLMIFYSEAAIVVRPVVTDHLTELQEN